MHENEPPNRKRAVDLTLDELNAAAGAAFENAAKEALAAGLPVTGSKNGRLVRLYPDGREQDLGPLGTVR